MCVAYQSFLAIGAKIDDTIFTNTLINQFTFFGNLESFKG